MVEKRCPDTGQIINFPADCAGCEFSRAAEGKKTCGYHIRPSRYKGKWR